MISAESIAKEIKKGLDTAALHIGGDVVPDMFDRSAYAALETTARGLARLLAQDNPGFNQHEFLAAAGFKEEW